MAEIPAAAKAKVYVGKVISTWDGI